MTRLVRNGTSRSSEFQANDPGRGVLAGELSELLDFARSPRFSAVTRRFGHEGILPHPTPLQTVSDKDTWRKRAPVDNRGFCSEWVRSVIV